MTTPALTVQRIGGALGAEIHGVDLASITDEEWEPVRQVWLAHHVAFFPDQHLDPEAQIALARRLGEPDVNPFTPKLDDDHLEVSVLDTIRTDQWHTDVTFSPTPPKASVLQVMTCPSFGGDTIWTNQELAFESLSPPLRDLLSGLTAVHDARPMGHPEIRTTHPAVRIHPETGRPSLFVNRSYTSHFVEMSKGESAALLQHLFSWSEQPGMQCRYRWAEGTVAIWDNRCTQHFGVADYSERRVLHRVTVQGDQPVGLGPRWAPFSETSAGASEDAPAAIDHRGDPIEV